MHQTFAHRIKLPSALLMRTFSFSKRRSKFMAVTFDWIVIQIGDNMSTSKNGTASTHKPHFGCMSKHLVVEVRNMLERYEYLQNTISSVNETIEIS